MGSDAEAQAAIAALNGQEHGGRALTVNEAKPQGETAAVVAAVAAVATAAVVVAAVRRRRWLRRSAVVAAAVAAAAIDPLRC